MIIKFQIFTEVWFYLRTNETLLLIKTLKTKKLNTTVELWKIESSMLQQIKIFLISTGIFLEKFGETMITDSEQCLSSARLKMILILQLWPVKLLLISSEPLSLLTNSYSSEIHHKLTIMSLQKKLLFLQTLKLLELKKMQLSWQPAPDHKFEKQLKIENY